MKKIFSFLALLFLGAFCGCTVLFFQPQGGIFSDPANEGQKYEVIKFHSSDGTELSAMYFRAQGKAAGTVVHFHGNAQNMTAHYPYSSWLAEHGFNVFVFDYRGYGASGGNPSVAGAVEDGAAALMQVKKIPDVDARKIAVFGQSLGGALAVAAIVKAGGEPPAALVLDSTFYSYRGVASEVLQSRWWSAPFFWLPWVAVSNAYYPGKIIGDINCPKLFFHAKNDPVVAFSQGEKLYNAAGEPKKLVIVPAGHCAAFTAFRPIYGPQLVDFLNNAFAAR